MSQRSLNRVQLIGNLTRDPELRYTPQGTAVCTFGLATNRAWVTESGEKKESVEFHRLVAWNKLAELCSQLLFKGRKIFAEGRLQTRQWEGQDGMPRRTTEVVIDEMIILDSRRAPTEGVERERVAETKTEPVAASPAVTGQAKEGKKKKDNKKEEKEKEEEEEEEDKEVKAEDIPF